MAIGRPAGRVDVPIGFPARGGQAPHGASSTAPAPCQRSWDSLACPGRRTSIEFRRTVLAGFVVTSLTSCAAPLPRLTHPVLGAERWKLDDAECARNATLVRGDVSGFARLFGRTDTENQVYYRCMVLRGYRPTIEGESRPIPKWEALPVEEPAPPWEAVESPAPDAAPPAPDAPERHETPEAADQTEAEQPIEADNSGDSVEPPDVTEPARRPDSGAPVEIEEGVAPDPLGESPTDTRP
jgi:hypothetical protein